MADVSLKIPIAFEGMLSNSKKIAESLVKNMENSMASIKGGGGTSNVGEQINKGFTKMLVKIGILAAIWEGFSTFLRPIMSLFKLIMILLFLPMMPLVKQMLTSMKDVAGNVKKAQDAAGGTGAGAFAAGVGALLSEPSVWGVIGTLIAVSMLGSLMTGLGAATFSGLLVAALTLSVLIANAIWNENNFLSQIGVIGLTGIGAFLLTLFKTGSLTNAVLAAQVAVALGLTLVFTVTAYNILSKDGTDIGEYFKAMATGAGAGALIGFMVGGPGGALAGGIIGIGVAILVTLLDVAWEAGWDTKMIEFANSVKEGAKSLWDKIFHPESVKLFKEGGGMVSALNFDEAAEASRRAFGSMESDVTTIQPTINTLNTSVGDTLITNISNSSTEWTSMKNVSVAAVDAILNKLSKIPRNITTTHHIRTVYDDD